MIFEPLSDHRCKLGESPFWWRERDELLFVDVHGGAICSWTAAQGTRSRRVGERITFIMPTANGGIVLGLRHGLAALAGFDAPVDGDLAPTIPVEADRPTTSINDARCDAQGRLFFGTLERANRDPVCFIYRWTRETGVEPRVPGVAISNGMQWSPDGAVMYFVDSHTQRLDAFDYDSARGELGRRRTVATIAPELGMPDGINVDAEGMIYVALYGGGAIHRYRPDGVLDRVIEIPVRYPTSLCFGGDDRRTMYVTTSSVGFHGAGGDAAVPAGLSDLDGKVLVAASDVPGLPSLPIPVPVTDFQRARS